jgi:hypothetical protein
VRIRQLQTRGVFLRGHLFAGHLFAGDETAAKQLSFWLSPLDLGSGVVPRPFVCLQLEPPVDPDRNQLDNRVRQQPHRSSDNLIKLRWRAHGRFRRPVDSNEWCCVS